jgi:hypothetical protein
MPPSIAETLNRRPLEQRQPMRLPAQRKVAGLLTALRFILPSLPRQFTAENAERVIERQFTDLTRRPSWRSDLRVYLVDLANNTGLTRLRTPDGVVYVQP